MIGMTAAAGALVYYARGDMLPAATVAAMLGTLAGALPAAWAGHRIGARGLRMAFSLFMLIVSLLMVRRGIAEL
jgi:uncharacterized membrane protein YfcA